ncbi:hypothetical protein MY1884_008658 [Beauveria asiatica]
MSSRKNKRKKNVVFLGNFALSVGDVIYMEVDASSETTGVAVLENKTTGEKVTHTFARTPSTLCETDAERIRNRLYTNNSAVSSAGVITPAGGTVINLAKEGTGPLETDCGIDGNDAYCKYIGSL